MPPLRSDAIVFFGATGDLAYKQIFPALMGLVRDENLSVPIVGIARAGWDLDQLRARAEASLRAHGSYDATSFAKFIGLLRYVNGDYQDPDTFAELRRQIPEARRPLHYMAIPPALFANVATGLAAANLTANARLVIEKPFGHDRASAAALNQTLLKFFPEEALFRIDHYLGKEPVQNITYTRFANPMFEPIWNRTHIASIQITMAEAFGVQDRGRFYDATGALRDVVQNHMLQVLANLLMDPPTGEEHEAMRDQKAEVLKALRPLDRASIVRGQYRGYRDVDGVAANSTVETFVAVKFFVESWRWAGVPIYIRAGKELPLTATEIVVSFRAPPRDTFAEGPLVSHGHLRFRLSPDVGISLGLRVKQPGEGMAGKDVEMTLSQQPGSAMPPYQRLLGDAMRGIGDLFGRQDIVDAQWRAVDSVLGDPALGGPMPCYAYEPGSWGPAEANALIGEDGPWRDPMLAPMSLIAGGVGQR